MSVSLYTEKHIIPQADIRFILCLILSSLIPNSTYVEMLKPKHPEQFSIHVHHGLGHSTPHLPLPTSVLLHQLALLGLKTLLVCCDDQLYNLLPILSKSVMEIGEQLTGVETLKFFNFLVTVRTVLYPLIKPYIHSKLLHKVMTTEDEDIALHNISCSIKALPSYIHKTQLLAEFAKELDMHRKTHISSLGELLRSASVSAGPVKKRRFSTWRKSSLISKIHQNDHSIHTSVATDHPPTIINASSIRAAPHCYTLMKQILVYLNPSYLEIRLLKALDTEAKIH
ncbi:unc-80 [Bugula neritina]|uniref:Unc-80 n=1 Tax=Bugula neritina TaxID=10212 RepID=A0A7J7KKT9_BUGNE|nr:unc-80 [Bugula neritina]